jgi:8-oxo-dGTP pyrophosphatase MutT (NUDIX family)
MKRLWAKLGMLVFWLSWPLFWLLLPHTRRARLLLLYDGKILVVKSWISSGKWGLPGGGLHRGEDAAQGVLREVAEETGIQLLPDQIKPLLSHVYRHHGLHFPCQYYYARLETPPRLQRQKIEITALAWLERHQLNEHNSAAEVLVALQALTAVK